MVVPIVDYFDYDVSDLGRMRSRKSKWKEPRILKPNVTKRGYHHYGLSNPSGKLTTFKVHQLVLLAFVGPRPEGMEVCHGPNGKADNSLANLSYGTREQNAQDRHRDGATPKGEKNASAKLTEYDVVKIRARRESGCTQASLALEYGVSHQLISQICLRQIWTHV